MKKHYITYILLAILMSVIIISASLETITQPQTSTIGLFSSETGKVHIALTLAEISPQDTRTSADLTLFTKYKIYTVIAATLTGTITEQIYYSTDGGTTFTPLSSDVLTASVTSTDTYFETSSAPSFTIASGARGQVIIMVEAQSTLALVLNFVKVGIEVSP